jgi:hypothetical protein
VLPRSLKPRKRAWQPLVLLEKAHGLEICAVVKNRYFQQVLLLFTLAFFCLLEPVAYIPLEEFGVNCKQPYLYTSLFPSDAVHVDHKLFPTVSSIRFGTFFCVEVLCVQQELGDFPHPLSYLSRCLVFLHYVGKRSVSRFLGHPNDHVFKNVEQGYVVDFFFEKVLLTLHLDSPRKPP